MRFRCLWFATLLSLGLVDTAAHAETHSAEPDEELRGVSESESSIDVTTKADKEAEYPRTVTCFIFADWVVFETRSGQMGADETRVRRRHSGQSGEKVCRARRGKDVVLSLGMDLYGMAGSVLVVRYSDSFGAQQNVEFYDAKTGRKLLADNYSLSRPSSVRVLHGGEVRLQYWRQIFPKCRLTQANCWKKTLEQNNVPARLSIPAPKCLEGDSDPNALQIFLPVHVDDVRRPRFIYETGEPICEPAP